MGPGGGEDAGVPGGGDGEFGRLGGDGMVGGESLGQQHWPPASAHTLPPLRTTDRHGRPPRSTTVISTPPLGQKPAEMQR
jgi:hypothetical protein